MFLTSQVEEGTVGVVGNVINTYNSFSAGANAWLWGLAYTLIPIIAYWYLFEKNGEAGWKNLIPFYGTYMKFKIFFKTGKFWRQFFATILLFVSFIVIFVGVVMTGGDVYNVTDQAAFTILAGFLLMLLSFIWIVIIELQFDISISRKYGRGFWFTLGMIFMTPIFVSILAYEVYKGRVERIE